MTASVASRRFALLQFALAAMLGAAMLANWPGSAIHDHLLNICYLLIGAPTLYALRQASTDPEVDEQSRRAWRLLSYGVACWWCGDAIWAVLAVTTGSRPPLSVADLAYVLFFPFTLRALATFPGLGPNRAERWRVQLDAVIASLTMATLCYWIWPMETNPEGLAHWLTEAVNIGYPIADVMLLTAAFVLMLRQTDPVSAKVMRLMTVAIGIKTAGDLLYARAIISDDRLLSSITDSCWIAWYGFITVAGIRARDLAGTPHESVTPTRRTLWLPYACVSLVGVLLVDLVQRDQFVPARGVSIGMLSLLAAVLMRQYIVSVENSRLDRLAAGREAEGRLAALVRHASDVIMVVDLDSTVRYVSPSVERILGLPVLSLQGTPGFSLLHTEDVEAAQVMLGRLAQHGDSQSMVCRVRHASGTWRWVEMMATNRLTTESINGIVINMRDVTERRELEGKLEWQAFHDPLTGLANRVLFTDRLSHALARRERSQGHLGVLFLDLDHFKAINDTLGHPAGDAVLREAARRIQREVRSSDTVARLGGDEFAVLLEDSDEAECQQTANRLLAQFARAFRVEGQEVFTTSSIGLTVSMPAVSLDDLVRDADVAMYVAKAEGRARVVRFQPSMREHVAERLHLEADLRRAIERSELQVYYQPQVDLRTGDVVGAEALLRWTHPTRGIIPPSKFIPIAEQAGLVVEMSRFVLRTACRDASTWRLPGSNEAELHVAVNLSGRHVQDPRVLEDVREALASVNLDPSLLTVEITESVMMHNTDAAVAMLRQLKALGITVAIDDFGTGYSSLSYLQQFPIDELKIDKSFVDKLGMGDSDDALTRAILGIGDVLSLATVAEGIETQRQLEELQSMGCLIGQGYLLSHPLPARTFAHALAAGDLLRLKKEVPPRARLVA
jgi:diguanylate cyclase (GGDEF)-like protein/PAS domain S-box-containing protein